MGKMTANDVIVLVRTALAKSANAGEGKPERVHVGADDWRALKKHPGMPHISIDGVRIQPNLFVDSGAPVVLPVGWVMRVHWCEAVE
jgi:hypothetical protein